MELALEKCAGAFGRVEAQTPFSGSFIWAVAAEAVVRENGADVAVVAYRAIWGERE